MTGALLIKRGPRWRVGLAFGAAVLIHCGALALASIHKDEQIEDAGAFDHSGGPIITIEPPDPLTPPEDLTSRPDPAISPPPVLPDEESIPEEQSSPPPPVQRQSNPKALSINPGHTVAASSVNLSNAKVFAVHAPRPEYPYQARRQRLTGSGVAMMTINPANGEVTDVSMLQSTGSPFLDNAAVSAFRRWRFKPGTILRVKVPITFTLTGAQY